MEHQTFEAGELPFEVPEGVGTPYACEEVFPGVYYLATQREDLLSRGMYYEHYVILESSPLYQAVSAYGYRFPGLRLYPMDENTSGWRIVDYEGYKYRVKHHIPLPEYESLHHAALYAAEYHPEYFGTYPVPLHTPRGDLLRYRALENGIYWIETSQCEEVLALCYPIWSSELTSVAVKLGEQNEYDLAHGIHKTLGYLFFPKPTSCIAFLELLRLRPEWNGTLIQRAALMNAVWSCLPIYAVQWNCQEQLGANDLLAMLLHKFEIEEEPNISMENMITLSPEAGTDFLLL